MECSVCLSDDCRVLRLTCSHPICEECLHKWYMKSASLDKDASCPICRRPVDFPGFSSLRDDWREAAYNSRMDELYGEIIDELAEIYFEESGELEEKFSELIEDVTGREILPSELEDLTTSTRRYMQKGLSDSLKRIDMTFRVCREEGWDLDEVEWLVRESGFFLSDRHLDKMEYIDEPPKTFHSRYTQTGRQALASKRCRARQDPWFAVTLAFSIDL